MELKRIKSSVIVLIILVFVSACGQSSPTVTPTTVSPTNQVTEVATPPSAGIPITGSSTEVAIQHTVQPGDLPTKRSNQATDYDSSTHANKKITTQDRFTYGQFERPFSANMESYFPQLDIINTSVFQDETWIYGRITIKSYDSNNSLADKYALVLDLDRDGKGDWLIITTNPTSKEWSVNGVQAFQDANKDVGGTTPLISDKNLTTGDGFEKLVFDQGKGDDPDSAWVRISPNDPNTIEIAVKRSVLGSPKYYLINMWAGTSQLDPKMFDINDRFTQEQAGAADPEYKLYYPIKAVIELDNSCQMAVGFQPTGQEPGLCKVRVEPESPDAPGAPAPGAPSVPGVPPIIINRNPG
jgi:hypothetical protein